MPPILLIGVVLVSLAEFLYGGFALFVYARDVARFVFLLVSRSSQVEELLRYLPSMVFVIDACNKVIDLFLIQVLFVLEVGHVLFNHLHLLLALL